MLVALSQNAGLSSFPALARQLNSILEQYRVYIAANADPWNAQAPQPLRLTKALGDALRLHYTSPPQGMDFFETIRDKGSPDVCPMCGSLKSGTLDHIYSKTRFPEFSVFSRNLVPACDCNTLRNQVLAGNAPGERLLHPYFDAVMTRRLVRARITSRNGDLASPEVGVTILIRRNAPLYPAVRFHLDNVILRTKVISHFENAWAKLLKMYDRYLALPPGDFTIDDIDQRLRAHLVSTDLWYGTPNNWDSMFFAGLLATPSAKQYLQDRIQDVRSNRIAPEEA